MNILTEHRNNITSQYSIGSTLFKLLWAGIFICSVGACSSGGGGGGGGASSSTSGLTAEQAAACNDALAKHQCGATGSSSSEICKAPSATDEEINWGWTDGDAIILEEGEFDEITATYIVPSDPPLPCNQAVYYFMGLEASGGGIILQPVLGWWRGEWSIRSEEARRWGRDRRGKSIRVKPGDEIHASVARQGNFMVITTAIGSDKSILTSKIEGHVYKTAITAFEVWDYNYCGNDPGTDFEFTIKTLKSGQGDVTQEWQTRVSDDVCQGDVITK